MNRSIQELKVAIYANIQRGSRGRVREDITELIKAYEDRLDGIRTRVGQMRSCATSMIDLVDEIEVPR